MIKIFKWLRHFFKPEKPQPVTEFDFKYGVTTPVPTSDEKLNYLFRAEEGYHPASTELSQTDHYYWLRNYMTFVKLDGMYYGTITDLGKWYIDDYMDR